MPFTSMIFRRSPWRRRFAPALFALSFAATVTAEEPSREYRIKAAYLYNLTKFITWPDEKSWRADSDFRVCIYGFNPFDTFIQKLSERTAKGHRIILQYPTATDQLRECQLVFVSQYNTEQPDLRKMQTEMPNVLTVGDDINFISHNGMVSLIAVGNNVQMDIHLTRARQQGFAVSADLLEIARKVE